MVPALRNRHFYIWLLLAFFLPAAFIWTLFALPPGMLYAPSYQEVEAVPFRDTIKEVGDAYFTIRLLKDRHLPGRQLEVNVRQAIPHPSPAVHFYDATMSDNRGIGLGPLQSVGTYRFDLPQMFWEAPGQQVIIYDRLEEKILHLYKLH